jgi:hypothetical protein
MSRATIRRRNALATPLLRAGFAAALALPVLVTVGAISARADEAYVCDGGRIVTVRVGELEAMKRKDPCIAAYYGIKADASSASPSMSAPAPAPVAFVEPPLPARRPSPVMPASAALPQQAAPHPVAYSGDVVTVPRVVPVAFRYAAPRRAGNIETPQAAAAAPVDFRNIPIINAVPGEPAVFHHAR